MTTKEIVLCPDLNDKDELDNTINDLSNLSHSIGSVAVVPVGLTAYREGLHNMSPFNMETASYTIDQVQEWQKKFKNSINRNFVHVSDEFYVLANRDFPNYENYEGFPQLENGVGLSTKFKYEFYKYLRRLPISLKKPKHITVVTGTAAYKLIKKMCDDLSQKIGNLKVEAICVENNFFGGHVSVSGLITGQDIYSALKDRYLGEKVLIPESMMKSEEEIFLDDYTVTLLEEKLGVSIQVCEVNGQKFVQRALDLKIK